ncbi:hypothetical protein PVE_R2G0154 [Pseudomonas veronii 1YdBTEX2]|uniref:Uncharacterized protein n=1 Tax=Pseudomonas veronii 1YdBTEX2 TaxID=1295141 RepID=A0A1D3K766_PSEVE|nr:hypothetical protein PVE_R2G0154 [Pseudomonas veronii 1YdBTEX2]
MKLSVEFLLQLSQADVPTWEEFESISIQLDDESLKRLNDVAQRIQSGCSNEDEARTEGTSKRFER